MISGNPSLWSMSNMRSISQDHHNTSSTFLAQYHEAFDHHRSSSSSSNLSLNSTFAHDDHDHDQEQLPHSWKQLLFCGFANEEDKLVSNHFLHTKKMENLEDQSGDYVKQENSQTSQIDFTNNGDVGGGHDFMNYNQNTCGAPPNWSHQQMIMPVSSPKSSVTSLGSNLFDFPSNKGTDGRIQMSECSYECNSTSTGGVPKKAKVQSSPTHPPLKVRKEKLGERITALHQIVSPFGKTDTASVLLEAIGYIRFFEGQIEALSSPYLCNTSPIMRHQQHGNQDGHNKKDLKSRGLCLVPLSCTHHISDDNGADYWAPQPGGGF